MRTISEYSELENARNGESLVMFGGADCSVCHAVKPKLEKLIETEFPRLESVYIDCQGAGSALCAQESVFSIPVVQIWFDGKKFAEFVRVFSIAEVREAIAKPYRLTFS